MAGWKKQCLFAIVLSSFLLLTVNGAPGQLYLIIPCSILFSEISQDAAAEVHDEQGYKQNDENDAYLAHELANQQDEEPMQQDEDLAADDDSMADQADESDPDTKDNALEQQDHDDANVQGKSTP